jgi:mannonate dehydratase
MLEQTWRWYGPKDRITFEMIKQTGATGIVSALYHIPTGDIWPKEEIRAYKKLIEDAGFKWSVVESIPMHEDIKKRTGDYQKYIENFKESIRNLGSEGIKTLCYNFMPVLDWSRTNLKFTNKDNTVSTIFDIEAFVIIDLMILKREGAEKEYPDKIIQKAKDLYSEMTSGDLEKLKTTFLLGLPGTGETFSLDEVMERINGYKNIDRHQLKTNLFLFLDEVIPVAEKAGVKMAIHPDDPPYPLLGVPRAVATLEDLNDIVKRVDSPCNGITLCTGSLGAGYFNDVPRIARKLSHRINFAHLRNVSRDENLNFKENYLFEGDIDIYEVMKALVLEEKERKKQGRDDWQIPMRPDHGNTMFDDRDKNDYPGYSLYGRMKSLAEIRGLEVGVYQGLNKN